MFFLLYQIDQNVSRRRMQFFLKFAINFQSQTFISSMEIFIESGKGKCNKKSLSLKFWLEPIPKVPTWGDSIGWTGQHCYKNPSKDFRLVHNIAKCEQVDKMDKNNGSNIYIPR